MGVLLPHSTSRCCFCYTTHIWASCQGYTHFTWTGRTVRIWMRLKRHRRVWKTTWVGCSHISTDDQRTEKQTRDVFLHAHLFLKQGRFGLWQGFISVTNPFLYFILWIHYSSWTPVRLLLRKARLTPAYLWSKKLAFQQAVEESWIMMSLHTNQANQSITSTGIPWCTSRLWLLQAQRLIWFTHFLTLESVSDISFNLHEFRRSWLMGARLLLMLITLKSSAGTDVCKRRQRVTRVLDGLRR